MCSLGLAFVQIKHNMSGACLNAAPKNIVFFLLLWFLFFGSSLIFQEGVHILCSLFLTELNMEYNPSDHPRASTIFLSKSQNDGEWLGFIEFHITGNLSVYQGFSVLVIK